MAHEQVNLGHRLKDEIALFAALERNSVLTQGLCVVALASECESEVVSRELALAGHLQFRPSALLFRWARTAALDRQIGVRARERGIQRDRSTRRRKLPEPVEERYLDLRCAGWVQIGRLLQLMG